MQPDPSGRVKIISAGMMMLPGCCAVCGSVGNERGYADPGIFIEWHGNIYFCENCAVELASIFGARPERESTQLEEQNSSLAEEVATLRADNERLESLVENLRYYHHGRTPTAEPDGNGTDASEDVAGESPAGDSVTKEPSAGQPSDESESVEPVTDDGPDDVDEPASSDSIAKLLGI